MTTDSVTDALRDSVRDVLARESDSARLHQFVDSGRLHDEALWREASALGWTALAVPEAFDGLALSAVETTAVGEELGRFLAPLPLLGSLLTVRALALGGSPAQQARWLPGLASGALKGAVAAPVAERGTSAPLARRMGDLLVIEGVAANVLQGGEAALLIVPVRLETEETAFVAVEPAVDGAPLTVEATQDRTRHLARLQMSGLRLPLDRLLAASAAADLARALQAEADLALAADSVGGADAIFERTLDYLKTREQFGKPIGSFQLMQGKVADMYVALNSARAYVYAVARACDAGLTTRFDAAGSILLASENAVKCALEAIQTLGGAGYTKEFPVERLLRDAKLYDIGAGTNEIRRFLIGRELLGG